MSEISNKKAETQPFVAVKKKFSQKIERVVFTNELRGTINLTSDENSYLVAGTNIDVLSGSDAVSAGYNSNQIVIQSSGGGGGIIVRNDGSSLGSATALNFTGGVTASGTGTTKTITVTGNKHIESGFLAFNKNATSTVSFDRVTSLGSGAYANVRSWMFAPFSGTITKVTIFSKGTTNSGTHGGVTLKVYVNANNFDTADSTSNFNGNTFIQVNAANPIVFKHSVVPNVVVNEGNLIQIQVTRDSAGSTVSASAIVQVEITES
jgi:hypothetical protein